MKRKQALAAGIPAELLDGPPARKPPRRSKTDSSAGRGRLEAETLLCEFFVPGRPAPWCAPRIGIGGGCVPTPASRRKERWQNHVRARARIEFQGDPYRFPVMIKMVFHIYGKSRGDLTNLIKSTEDAMRKIVFADDRQVELIKSFILPSSRDREGVDIEVVAGYAEESQ